MYLETRKLHLIEEVLKVNNDVILKKLESVLKISKKTKNKELSIFDFVGVISEKNASIMEKTIQETCETTNEDDWK